MEVDQKNALYGDSHNNKSEGNGLWLMYQMILDGNKALPLILLFSGR